MTIHKHTKTPWVVGERNTVMGDHPGDRFYVALPFTEHLIGPVLLPGIQAANARRIVACVNACVGIPTDALEKGRLSSDAFRLEESRADKAEQQRDELLAALEALTAHWDDLKSGDSLNVDAARAAIAKATA